MLGSFLPLALLALATPNPSQDGSAPSPNVGSLRDPIQISQSTTDSGQPVCYKMRTYIFERNDEAAPKLVRETTCGPSRPQLHRSQAPKVKLIPAN